MDTTWRSVGRRGAEIAAWLALSAVSAATDAVEDREPRYEELPVLVVETADTAKVVIRVKVQKSDCPKKDRLKMLEEAKAKLESAIRTAKREREWEEEARR